MVMVMRPSRASLPSYTRVDVEPQEERGTRGAYSHDKSRSGRGCTSIISRLLLSSVLRKALAAVAVLAPVVFLLIWNHLFTIDVGSVLAESRGGSSIERTFTVRMNTFRRNDLLKRSAEHLASCDCVDQIQVVWSDQQNAPPGMDLFADERTRRKVRFEVHDTNSLNHRFNATSPVGTEGVFSTDDDLEISCADLRFGFEAWQASKHAMVGYSPRLVTRDPETGRHSYRSWRVVRWNGIYNVILTKCCFLHRNHLKTYAERMTERLLAYIDEHRNCEDIAMSVVVAKFHGAPPVWVSGRVKEIGGDGISGLAHHFDARSDCVDFFAKEFGDDTPLLESSKKVYPRRTGLLSWL